LITSEQLKYVLSYTASAVDELKDELNALDRAIGDGDHGHNMSRGFQLVLKNIDNIKYQSLSEVFVFVGTTLMSSIGGAAGALYGSLFIQTGKSLPSDDKELTLDIFVGAFEQGVGAIKELGHSDVNQKTMLDVIVPVLDLLRTDQKINLSMISDYAKSQSQLTVNMKAEKGRASFLGDRSIGHLDPGARSSQVIISSICKALTLV